MSPLENTKSFHVHTVLRCDVIARCRVTANGVDLGTSKCTDVCAELINSSYFCKRGISFMMSHCSSTGKHNNMMNFNVIHCMHPKEQEYRKKVTKINPFGEGGVALPLR